MKLILSTILFGLFSPLGAYSQEYAIPRKLPIERAVRREFPDWHRMPNGYSGLIPETFFPIGWSKDGKFPYSFEPVDEACGCYYAGLVIQDMRNDKVVWEFKYNQDDD